MIYKQIQPSWEKIIEREKKKRYFSSLSAFVTKERKRKNIFPREEDVFAAFKNQSIDDVKVVVLGQDPYHTKGMANGLAFCVEENQKIPPSLRNIYKEIKEDTLNEPKRLQDLKDEGVLFLNTILTVEEGAPLSHKNQGWEQFTDAILKELWASEKKIVFLLWGKAAKRKSEELFKGKKGHLVLIAGHPSPLSFRYFSGCKHFTKANTFLKKERNESICWSKK